MFYRAVAIFIVLFWLAMTGLLVHQELRPGDSTLREVPPAHVVKLVFMHHQTSTLNIYSDKLRLGQLVIIPELRDDGQSRDLKFQGDLQILIPGGKRERIAWRGRLEMDRLLTVKRFQLAVDTHTPTDLTSEITILPEKNLARYELRASNGTIERQDYTLDERGARAALEQAGIDASLLPISNKKQVSPSVEIKARQSTLVVPGGRMDTYLVTMESNGQTLLEFHVDQLGRVVQANTLLGYTLSPDATTP
ncbi:MAG: hypothetical protein ABJF10_17630 [Chthoniobacter sp.]|uniref:hypothetical protein n=1 Tax=Chthoniobacter sp. TaxID=2510640 RepID=UPI0032A9AEC0